MSQAVAGPVRARTIARLKWRLWRNGFRRGGSQTVGIVVSLIAALLAGLGAAAFGFLGRRVAFDTHRTALTVAATAVWLFALIGPLIAGGVDETLPVSLLRPYPIRRRALAGGLLLAGMIGPAAAALAFGLVGIVAGAVRSPVGVVIATVAALVLFAEILVTARILPTLFARAMSSRRGRDAAMALASLVGFSGLIMQVLGRFFAKSDPQLMRRAAGIVRWTPPGALGRAIAEGGRGHLRPAALGVAIGVAGLAALGTIWSRSLARLDEQSPADQNVKAIRHRGVALFTPGLGWLPRTPVGVIAARQIRMTGRDPRRRVALIAGLVFGVVFPVINNVGKGPQSAVLFGALASWLPILNGMNQLGMDGRALWIDLLSGAPPATLLKGRSLGLMILALPIVAAGSITLAALTHGWAYLPAALLVGTGTTLAGLGAAAFVSVTAPLRVPEGSNPFAMNTSGQGCITPLLSLLGVFAVGGMLLPFAIALVVLKERPLACLIVGLLAFPYGFILWRYGLRLAAGKLVGREPELITLVDPRG
jgi:ABC-2 type transport system permease protein